MLASWTPGFCRGVLKLPFCEYGSNPFLLYIWNPFEDACFGLYNWRWFDKELSRPTQSESFSELILVCRSSPYTLLFILSDEFCFGMLESRVELPFLSTNTFLTLLEREFPPFTRFWTGCFLPLNMIGDSDLPAICVRFSNINIKMCEIAKIMLTWCYVLHIRQSIIARCLIWPFEFLIRSCCVHIIQLWWFSIL